MCAVAVPAGQFLEPTESLADPVPHPFRDGRILLAERSAQVVEHAQILQRVDVAGDAVCHGPHDRAAGEIGRQQRRIGMGFLQVLDDRERLAEHAIVVGERRHQALRIHLAIGLAVLLAAVAHEVHGHRSVRIPFHESAMRTRQAAELRK